MAYKNYAEIKKAIKDLRTGVVTSIPCTECETGVIHSDPKVPIKNQNTFYCDKCDNKIIIN